jgi:hypothetical protein
VSNQCIYCSGPPDGREHWLPRSLGRFEGFTPLLGRVCNDCDGGLGRELDDEFAHTGPTALFRHIVGVSGYHAEHKKNTFFFRAQTDPTNVATMSDGTLLEIDENLVASPLRHLVVRGVRLLDNRYRPFPLPRGPGRW